jgi:hypothetical protein
MTARRCSCRPHRVRLMLLAAILLIGPALAGRARADDASVDCKALDIDFADKSATKKCYKEDLAEGGWIGWRQTLIAKGPGYTLLFIRLKAALHFYISVRDPAKVPQMVGQWMTGSAPSVYRHDPDNGFDIIPFTGNYADPARKPISCFAFAHYQGTVVARGGFAGPPGYAASYSGGYCEANSQKLSDAYIAHIVGMLELPQE